MSNASPCPVVLVLGDLGCLDHDPPDLCQSWLRLGRELRAVGSLPAVLFPGPRERFPDRLAEVWRLVPWERPRPWEPADSLESRANRLLRLVSPAVRLEPGLLRATRLLLPADQADAGTEADVWQHPDLDRCSAAGATLNPERAKTWRTEFAEQLAPELQARFGRLLRTWRGYLPEEIWFEELLNLSPAARAAAEVAQDLAYARDYFADFVRDSGNEAVVMTGNDLDWFGRVERRAGLLWRDEGVGDDLQRLSYAIHQQEPDYRPPEGFRPHLIRRPDKPVRRLTLFQRGELLEFLTAPSASGGSLLVELSSRNGLIQVEPWSSDPDPAFWCSAQPPSWADDWGRDEYGPWVSFSVEDKQGHKVTQRMRWLQAGRFLMGSPENEPERFADEGPRHRVTLSRGFWLFDTACTQELWEAVMANNPSRFQSSNRPVERVSWHEVQEFIAKINAMLPGLELGLPSEAQWEYACRAGTETAIYSGDIEILGERYAPALDPIAWYGGNSGVGFELKNGYDSSSWPEKQYQHKSAGTHPMKLKRPNPWGLYDMLGNVWEWCRDGLREYGAEPVVDPLGPTGPDVFPVLRGGSWGSDARYVRAACRNARRPDYRVGDIGFRCARVSE